MGCISDGGSTDQPVSGTTHDGHSVQDRYVIECANAHDGLCETPRACPAPPGTQRYDIYESIDGGPFKPTGRTVCLTAAQAAQDNVAILTPAMVAAAFRRLTWPAPTEVIQPPGGKTLVNFRTNFYTELADPQTKTVTLLGQPVTIEADPARYTWDFGDGSTPETTTGPGAAYPDLTITHTYQQKTTVHPRVTVTYVGRYRLGQGPWQRIPVTLDVAGPARALRILTATPVLVG